MASTRTKTILKVIGVLVLIVVAILGAWAWVTLRVEEIPKELPRMERSADDLDIPAVGSGDDLRLAELHGHKNVIIFEGFQSMRTEQGKEINSALNRWTIPENVKVHIVFDGEGMEMFKDKVSRFTDFFASEVRHPVYIDFKGEVLDVFKLVKGHHGIAVVDPEGKTILRNSGGFDKGQVEELREMLGASEPPPPQPAPPFSLAGLDNESCKQKPCIFIFMGKKVTRAEIPWIEGGFEGNRTDSMERMTRPEIRMAASAMRLPIKKSHGLVVGELEGLDLKGWQIVPDDAEARKAFELAPDDSALVVIDTQGRMVFKDKGFIPMYRWSLAIDETDEKILREGEDD
ncbi:MAG: hypothetical protein AAF799_08400 [Myxococcota bacterium]